ncbi:uncharacterized protein K02A2.6-like [Patiria miniata]|uniref:Uncharacterized protein n=1 Tax=Patiria miniata TaxID=46514 RepID=A0A914BJ74_PATMI|nr:uncharacterized protein K02A2.6-like [Patiria miniata]
MSGLKPPGQLQLEGNLAKNWKEWVRSFELYAMATELQKKPEPVQCATFLHVAGPAAQRVYATLTFADDEKDKLQVLKAKFKQYCEPKRNLSVLRYMFNSRNQKVDEPFDTYLTNVKCLVRECEFGDIENSLLRDRVVCGVKDTKTREKLLQEDNLTLEKCINICQVSEMSATHVKALQAELNLTQQRQEVNRVTSTKARPPTRAASRKEMSNNNAENGTKSRCDFCTYVHFTNRCPAKYEQCNSCHKVGHFSKSRICKAQHKSRPKMVREVNESSDDDEDNTQYDVAGVNLQEPRKQLEDLMIDYIAGQESGDWTETCQIGRNKVDFKLDSGSQADILPEDCFKNTGLALLPSNASLKSYSGHKIKALGKTIANLKVGTGTGCTTQQVVFQVVSGNVKPILGLKTCQRLGLIKRVRVDEVVSGSAQNVPVHSNITFTEHNDLYEGLGKLQNHEYEIELNVDAAPVQNPPRTIPYTLRDKVKAELERMEKLGVIARVEEPTDWVSSMSIVGKPDGSVRICLDPRELNNAIKRAHYPMPTLRDVAARMPQAKVFSKFDATSGYWQLPLTQRSSYLTTFNTPFGRFRYMVLPFGISSASEIWQCAMVTEFGALEGVEIVVDDILVWGENTTEHDERVAKFLEKVRESGLKLNRKKSVIGTDKLEYVGHVISAEGLSPSPARIQSVLEMPIPTNKHELETFLGMITYVSKFIPNLSEITAPLRQLTEKQIAWHWDEKHTKAVETLKHIITSAPVLMLYDVNKPVSLATDASKHGFGSVLMQDNNRPVAYASRSTSPAEKNYATIEKEMCAILFACHKFHDYIFGKQTTVITDHKPLVGVFQKPLHKLSPRLQRMRMHLLRYDLSVQWQPGNTMFVPDALSRIINSRGDNISEFDDSREINMILRQLPITELRLQQFREETAADPTLAKVKGHIMNGWPVDKHHLTSDVGPYYAVHNELVFCDGILFLGNRVVVPRSMQEDMLKKIHESHLGIVKLKQRARAILYWPGMNSQIEDTVAKCAICQSSRKTQPAEPMIQHDIPDRPWSKLGADVFHLGGVNYLLVVDYYSKFPEVQALQDLTAHSVIHELKIIFARSGTPDLLITDNASQFVCEDFRTFQNMWEFRHVTSSPRYPQSNGQAERCIQTVKTLMKKAKVSGRDPYMALLEYRNTPLDGTEGYAPAQLLNSRLLKSRLPTSSTLLQPQVVPPMKAKLKERQTVQKHYYDAKCSKPKRTLHTGEQVRFQNPHSQWVLGKVTVKHDNPRSYMVATPTGQVYRRNRRHIVHSKEHADIEGNSLSQPNLVSPSTQNENIHQTAEPEEPSETKQHSVKYDSVTVGQTTTTRSGRVVRPTQKLDL